MKIGIITRHSIANYGSLLQTYATQRFFEKMEYETEIINYIRQDEHSKELVNTYINNQKLSGIKSILYKIIQTPNILYMNKKFKKYREKYLKMTDSEYMTSEELSSICDGYDSLCVGSDQVWGPIGCYPYDENYFLKFTDESKKIFSFSSSFGSRRVDEKLRKNLKKLLSKFSFITVREESAKDIIETNTNKSADVILDPTMLLNKEDWDNITKQDKTDFKKKYMLIYQLHHNKDFDNYAKKIAKKNNLKIYRISPSFLFVLYIGKFIYLPSIEKFLNYIKNADLVLTDSFHGTVFSLIFNTPMVDILPSKTSTRIRHLLKEFELEDRIVDDYNKLEFNKINFIKVNKKIEKLRMKSINIMIKNMEDLNND